MSESTKTTTITVRNADDKPTDAARDAEIAFWKARYEEERLRVAKLWVAYKALEDELENPPQA